MMRLELATKAYQGARTQQQDAAAALSIDDRKSAVLVLADGLGGHKGGAEAAQFVVDTFRQAAEAGEFTAPPRRWQALRKALDAANARIAGGVDPADGHRSMASTAVVAVVAEGMLNWISVGDSHLYLWRRGKLAKLNEDHSQAGLMVRSGQYKEDDPEVQAVKSVLVSALTGRKLEIVDHPANAYQLESGDVLLLASDGLNTLSETEIEAIVSGGQELNAAALSAKLVDTVEERKVDRQDNTTVAIARVIHAPQRAASEARTEISLAKVPQPITTPTVIPSAQRRAEVAPAQVEGRPADTAASAVTQRIDAVPAASLPNAEEQARPVVETARPTPPQSPPAASQANVRTAALPGSELPASKPPQRPAPELKATKPMSPPLTDPKPSRNPTMALLGLVMFVLAALLGAIALGKMAGFNVLDGVLGTSKTVAPPVEKAAPPQQQAPPLPAPAPVKAAPPPQPKQDAQSQPAPRVQEPVKAAPPPVQPSPVQPPQVLPPTSLPAPVAPPPALTPRNEQPAPAQPRPAEAAPVTPPASSSEPGGGNRGPDGGPAPNSVPQVPRPQQRAPLPGQQGAVPQGAAPQAPIRTPPVPSQQGAVPQGAAPQAPLRAPPAPGQTRLQAQQPSPALDRQARCRFHQEFGQFESFQHCSSECVQLYGFSSQANQCTAICRSLCL